jgi:hypothetical protein
MPRPIRPGEVPVASAPFYVNRSGTTPEPYTDPRHGGVSQDIEMTDLLVVRIRWHKG